MDEQGISGAIAAAVTPLCDEGCRIDENAVGELMSFYRSAGLDGVLALGSTGEGILLSVRERKVAAELYLQAAEAPVRVAIHCGAQNTADTIDLASHAAEHGADAVVAIGPPYYAFDEQELFRHFLAAAGACAPTPFYLYEFPARAGYSLSPSLVRRLLDAAPNLAGVKVSGKSFDQIKTFLELGQLNVFVGAESLIYSGMAQGAAGAVSALASAFPGLVASAVHDRSSAVSTERAGKLREQLEQFPIQAALKRSLVHQGVAMRTDVRAPLRDLSPAERDTLDGVLAGAVASGAAVSGAAAKR